jgi:hypothetical protein
VKEFDDLSQKIVEARARLPLPKLMTQEGLGAHAKKSARCPFAGHEDMHPSFSVYEENGRWRWTCWSKCGSGDEIDFLCKLRGISKREGVSLYLEMAGFPPRTPPKSHEYPKSHVPPECPVSPVSGGQTVDGETEKRLSISRAECLHTAQHCTDTALQIAA